MFNIELILRNGFEQGLIWALLVIGVYISFRILDIADLSIEGVFPLGGAVACLLINNNVDPFLSTILCFFAGAIGGLITGLMHTKLKIPAILAGIITMTAFSSINLVILGMLSDNAKAVSTYPFENDVFTSFKHMFKGVFESLNISLKASHYISIFIVSSFILVLFSSLIYWFFGTEIGMNIRCTGNNPKMARAQGIDTDKMIVLGLMISNGLIALSGALFSQDTGNAMTESGKGAIVIGLAAIILGEIIFGKKRSFKLSLISIIIGAIIFFIIKALAIELKVEHLLNLFVALIIALILALPLIKTKIRKGQKNAGN